MAVKHLLKERCATARHSNNECNAIHLRNARVEPRFAIGKQLSLRMHIRLHVRQVERRGGVLVDVRCQFPRTAIFASGIKQLDCFKSGVAPHGYFAWLAGDGLKFSNGAFAVIFRTHACRHDPAAHISEPHAALLNQGLHFRTLSGAVQDVCQEDRCIKCVRRFARNQYA